MTLDFAERPASGQAEGLLALHHGRGSDENDLIGLADALDPGRRFHVVAPGGPLTLPGWPGRHWYAVPRVGFPDPDTFWGAHDALAKFHDAAWNRTGLTPQQTILGGFSMGTVMSYALGLSADRPPPAGILAFSGFVPTVEGWEPSTSDRRDLRTFIAHGRADPVMDVSFARAAGDLLEGAGLAVDYHEFDSGHNIDPAAVPLAQTWIERTISS